MDSSDQDQNLAPRIAEVFRPLSDQVVWLNFKWRTFLELYGQSKDRVALLNESAPAFFNLLQTTLRNDVLVALTRLTDPARSNSNANLSLGMLLERVRAEGHTELCNEVEQQLNALREQVKPFRKWRDKRLVHLDLPTALARGVSPLPTFQRKRIDCAVKAAGSLMNHVSRILADTEMAYEMEVGGGGAKRLIFHLEKAQVQLRREREELRQRLHAR